jgi:hypothetical protein
MVSDLGTVLSDIGNRQVRVVRHKKTKQMYALKYVKKKQCVQQKVCAGLTDSSTASDMI